MFLRLALTIFLWFLCKQVVASEACGRWGPPETFDPPLAPSDWSWRKLEGRESILVTFRNESEWPVSGVIVDLIDPLHDLENKYQFDVREGFDNLPVFADQEHDFTFKPTASHFKRTTARLRLGRAVCEASLAEVKAQKELEEIRRRQWTELFNNCLIDKMVGISEKTTQRAIQGICYEIAENPSVYQRWKYSD